MKTTDLAVAREGRGVRGLRLHPQQVGQAQAEQRQPAGLEQPAPPDVRMIGSACSPGDDGVRDIDSRFHCEARTNRRGRWRLQLW